MPKITLFYIFLSSMVATLVMIPFISRLAIGMGILDRPDSRKVHLSSTPRLGGIAIFFAFLLAVFLFSDIGRLERGFLAGAVIIFLIGLADDLTGLTPYQKLAGQASAALTAVIIGEFQLTSLGDLFGLGDVGLGMFAIPFSVLAIVGVTNAINLLDGLDGLAAGVSAIAAVAMAVLAFHSGNMQLLYLTVALLGAILGFLKFNTYPASIFMGDAGSLFLGYCMGVFSLMLVVNSKGTIVAATPLMILVVPVLDTIFVMGKRVMAGGSPFNPDNKHIHHRFLDLGLGHRLTVILVYVFSYLMAALAVFFHDLPNYELLLILGIAYTLVYSGLKVISHAAGGKLREMIRSNRSIRDTRFSRRLAEVSRHLQIGIKYLTMAVLLLSICIPHSFGRDTALICAFLILISGALVFTINDLGNRFLLFILYFDGAFIIYLMENLGRSITIFHIPVLFFSHLMFIILFVLVWVKIFLRKRNVEMFGSPIEYLIFFIVLSTPLLPYELTGRYHLLSVAGKSVILFSAYKLVLMRKANRNRKILLTIVTTLLVLLVRYAAG
jgi:UDP-GlcNAc:undecaprenyl-phosphate/decaprenyl-phosphate GlcNAc-1-phosphate transferase